MKITLKEVKEKFPEFEILNYEPNVFFEGFSSDSRIVKLNEIFIPIKGENFDGHDYIKSALEKGASVSLCEASKSLLVNNCIKPIIFVDSIQEGLQKLLNLYMSMINVPIVAITGSVGKTTTRKMLSTILSIKGTVLSANKSNINTVWGNASLLSTYTNEKYIVLECGMDSAGEIAWHMNSIDPDLGILLNVGYVHAEKLGSIEAVYQEKKNMADYLSRTGKPLILNIDDERLARIKKEFKGELITFGKDENADFRIEKTEVNSEGLFFHLIFDEKIFKVFVPVYGKELAYNVVASIAAAYKLGVSIEDSIDAIKRFEPEPGRFEKFKLTEGGILIDDAYNANPASMSMSLESFSNLYPSSSFYRVVLLGDMKELGKVSGKEHTLLGEKVKKLNFDEVLYIGDYFEAFKQGKRLQSIEEAVVTLKEIQKKHPNMAVLMKASHSIGLENIVSYFSTL